MDKFVSKEQEVAYKWLTSPTTNTVKGLAEFIGQWKKVQLYVKGKTTHYRVWLTDDDEASFSLSYKGCLYPRYFREEVFVGTGVSIGHGLTNEAFYDIAAALGKVFQAERIVESDWNAFEHWLLQWWQSPQCFTAEERINDYLPEDEYITPPITEENLGAVLANMMGRDTDKIHAFHMNGRFYFSLEPFVAFCSFKGAGLSRSEMQSAMANHSWTTTRMQKWWKGKNRSVRLWSSNAIWPLDSSVLEEQPGGSSV